MKIVNKKEFRELKTPFVFSHYRPCIIEDLFMCVDNTSMKNDIVQVELLGNVIPIGDEPEHWGSGDEIDLMHDAVEKGIRFRLDLEGNEREGLYDDDKLYVIYEEEDVITLIKKLTTSLSGTSVKDKLLSKIKSEPNIDIEKLDEFIEMDDFMCAQKKMNELLVTFRISMEIQNDILYKKYKLWLEENK